MALDGGWCQISQTNIIPADILTADSSPDLEESE